MLTCTGDLSRNRNVGIGLGQGKTLDTITAGMNMVAEGVATAQSAHALAKHHGVDMPIVAAVYRGLYEQETAPEAVRKLMSRKLRPELDAEWAEE